jgi:hypothetical protein
VNTSGAAGAGPVTAADVDQAVGAAADALSNVVDRDWRVPARGLDWDCWETVEHICDDLFAYAGQLGPRRPPLDGHVPFAWQYRRPGGPAGTIFADPAYGQAGLIQVLEASGTLLAATVRTRAPDVRAHHVFGASDPEGFAAMGVVETLVHMSDVAAGLAMAWMPPPDLCDRALRRLFPAAPGDTDRWQTLLWATGRGEIPGHPALTSWRWHGEPRDGDAPGRVARP